MLVAAFAVAAPAMAMEVEVQDDSAIVTYPQERAEVLPKMVASGVTNVRINVYHTAGPASGPADLQAGALQHPLQSYDDAVAAIRAAGLTPQLTLVWYGQADPAETAAWMGAVAAHFGSAVDRYSVLNEPDLTLPASNSCSPAATAQLVDDYQVITSSHTTRRKVYATRRVRVRRHGRVRYVTKPVYVRRPASKQIPGHRIRMVRVRKFRWVSKTMHTNTIQTISGERISYTAKQGCLAINRGALYHAIFIPAAAAIHAADPSAQVLAGETSAATPLDEFIKSALPLPGAAGWAHHPYQMLSAPNAPGTRYGIGDLAEVQRRVGMPLYITEFGYPFPQTPMAAKYGAMYTQPYLTQAYPLAWRTAFDAGVQEMSQYMWCVPPDTPKWDTALNAGCDSDVDPTHDALAAEIALETTMVPPQS
jgi:hypothetical protein